MGLMSAKNYERLKEAKKAGDTKLMAEIRANGMDDGIIDVEVEMDTGDVSESVLEDLSAGLSRKEICSKYNISTQKITSIVGKDK